MMMYTLHAAIEYRSVRYGKTVTVPAGYKSDGATGAIDIFTDAWFVHDWLCGNYLGSGPRPVGGVWDDGTKLTNWQCSTVLYDILMSEGHTIRAPFWRIATWLFGGGVCRKQGMF